jgi:hypothetical protein
MLVVPQEVKNLLSLGKVSWLGPLLTVYKLLRKIKLDWFLKSLILPDKYKSEIKDLDTTPE